MQIIKLKNIPMKRFTFIITLLLVSAICFAQREPRLMTKAKKLEQKGNYQACLELMDRLVSEQPDYAGARFYRGEVLTKLELYNDAIRDFSNGIKIMNLKTVVAFNQAGLAKMAISNYHGAIEDFTKAVEIFPEFNEAYLNRGDVKIEIADYKGAIADYTKALLIDPRYAIAYYKRGLAKSMINNYASAIEDYENAIAYNLISWEVYNALGFSLFKLRQFTDAIASFNHSIHLDPRHAVTFKNRGDANRAARNFNDARLDYVRAYNINPRYYDAYNEKGLIEFELIRYEEAYKDFTKAIEMNPRYETAIFNRGRLLRVMGKHDEAIRDFTRVIELNPLNISAFINRGNTKREIEDFEGAIEDANIAIEIDNNSATAYFLRGYIYYYSNNYVSAIDDYSKALYLNIDNAYRVLHFRGRAKLESGDTAAAALDFQKSIELIENAQIKDNSILAYSYFFMGNNARAIQSLYIDIAERPYNPWPYYNMACLYSLMNRVPDAINFLEQAFDKGFTEIEHMGKDSDLNNIKNTQEFRELIARLGIQLN